MKFIFIFFFFIIPAIECILNGLTAHHGQFPYMAGLLIKRHNVLNCGGTIISSKLIITTAHCVCHKWSHKYYTALVGTNDLKDGGIQYELDKSICHENFQPYELAYDVGIVRTTVPIVFTPDIQFISVQTEAIPPDSWVLATGWGCLSRKSEDFPDDLRYSFLQIVPQEKCKEIYWDSLEFNFICSLRTEEEGTCDGDSGGPVIYNGRLAGITYGGANTAPDLYVNISSFSTWIHNQIYLYNRDDHGNYIADGDEHDYYNTYGFGHNIIPDDDDDYFRKHYS